jgi:hypothetical protein
MCLQLAIFQTKWSPSGEKGPRKLNHIDNYKNRYCYHNKNFVVLHELPWVN